MTDKKNRTEKYPSEIVQESVIKDILDGELLPGERVMSERMMAQEFRVLSPDGLTYLNVKLADGRLTYNAGYRTVVKPKKKGAVADTLDEIMGQKRADTPVIGFCGGPLTCLCYMLGGRDKTMQFTDVVRYLYTHREESLQLLDAITSASEAYVHLQAAHGIDTFQIFESFAGVISAELYQDMMMPFVRRITAAVRQHGLPVIFFPKGFGAGLQMLTPEDCDYVSIDWQTPLLVARHLVNPAIGLQGNMDPRILFAPQAVIEQHLQQYLAFFREHPNYIFNLGHGVHKDTPLENVQFVTEWFRQTQK